MSTILLAALAIVSPARAQPTGDSEARTFFWRGAAAYEQGDYEVALEAFQQSYVREPLPEILFNIAQCHDRLRHDAEALRAFRRFVASVPSSDDRRVALARIEVLERAQAERETRGPPPDVPPPDAPPDPPPPERNTVIPWALIVAGAVLTVTGSIIYALGRISASTVEDAPPGSSWTDVRDDYERVPTFDVLGAALLLTGAVSAGTGAVFLF